VYQVKEISLKISAEQCTSSEHINLSSMAKSGGTFNRGVMNLNEGTMKLFCCWSERSGNHNKNVLLLHNFFLLVSTPI